MVGSIPVRNLLPKPDLLQEIVLLLVKVGRLPRLGNDDFFNCRDIRCLAGGKRFQSASDAYAKPFESGANAKFELGLLAFSDPESFLRRDGVGVVGVGFVDLSIFENPFEPLRPGVQAADQVLIVISENDI